MSDTTAETSAPPETRDVQCPFCHFTNKVNVEDPICLDCGLELGRFFPEMKPEPEAAPEPVSPTKGAARKKRKTKAKTGGGKTPDTVVATAVGGSEPGPSDAVTVVAPPAFNEEDADTDPIELLLGGALEERDEASPAAAELSTHLRDTPAPKPQRPNTGTRPTMSRPPKTVGGRRSSRAPWVIASAFGVLVLGATIATGVILSAPNASATSEATPEKPATRITLSGWDATPAWVVDGDTEATAESRDGATLIAASGDTARIIDTATGDIVATQKLTGKATPLAYWAGDTALVVDGGTLHLWTSDTAHGDTTRGRDTDSKRDDDTATWSSVDLGDTSLALRGDMVFAVEKVGATYDAITPDATRDSVAVPTEGAVPVAASGDTITWGTNKGVAYVTDQAGKNSRDIALKAPGDTATVSRWIGGDQKHVYVVWTDGDSDTVAVHSLKTGDMVSSLPLRADRDQAATLTRDGAHVAYAGLLIDATTGATTETSRDIQGAVGDKFISVDPAALVNPAGGATELTGDTVTPVALTPDGNLVVDTGDTLAALTPVQSKGAREK